MAKDFVRSVTDPYSVMNDYLDYAIERTDAAHDYHEANSLLLLSLISHGIRFPLPSMPDGLRTNLFIIQYGVSSFTRKSTVMDIAKDVQQRAIPGCGLPPDFTPGGLQEELASRSGEASILYIDEFTRVLDQMHNQSFMSGLRGFLLTMYGSDHWEYRRTSKGTGNKKTKDAVVINNSHLCLVGNVTPTITKYLQPRDIEDGFMARFAIIWPEHKPQRKTITELGFDQKKLNNVVWRLTCLRQMCQNFLAEAANNPDYDPVFVESHALTTLDEFQGELEAQHKGDIDTVMIMKERVGIMAFKLSLLIAISRKNPETTKNIVVEHADAVSAIQIARKWAEWGANFAGSLYENEIDTHIRRVKGTLIEFDGELARHQIAKKMRLSKRQLDEVQMTMCDRGDIILEEKKVGKSHKPTLVWIMPSAKGLVAEEAKSTPLEGRGIQRG